MATSHNDAGRSAAASKATATSGKRKPRTPTVKKSTAAAAQTPPKIPAHRVETARRLKAGQATLSKITLQRIEAQLPWFRQMSNADRSWVVLLANSGISSFIDWYKNPQSPIKVISEIFSPAPRELVTSVSLQQTLQLLRVVVQVVEERVTDLARNSEQRDLRDAVLIYSREIAFAAADVYARTAEARGSWDARLEAMVIDALVRGDSVDELASRSAAFGWRSQSQVCVLMGRAPRKRTKRAIDTIRRTALQWAEDALVGIHDDRLLVVLGGPSQTGEAAAALAPSFGPSAVVIGPMVSSLAEAGTSAAAAVWALRTAPARPATPRPVRADDLLPERAMAGDGEAVRTLVERYFEPLVASSGQLLDTAGAYLEFGGSLDATAKALSIHPNTVRYRLRKMTDVLDVDPTEPRSGFVLRIALVYGRLSEAGQLSTPNKT